MFTGIIEKMGEIRQVLSEGSNKTFWISSPLSQELKVDQSLAHDGVCLTVEETRDGQHRVTAIAETLTKTNLSHWQPGRQVNLERSLLLSSRLDGHFVQGHVDATGICREIVNREGSFEFEFEFPEEFSALVIEKGSICINGISLTAWEVKKTSLKVGIIPYTFEHTNLQYLKEGDKVNLEFDMIGKYLNRKLNFNK
jgi:riboflavin synthase